MYAAKGLTPVVVGSFAAVVGIPWSLQFVWGPILDKFQGSAMGRRRPWVILSQVLAFVASLSILWVDDPVRQVSLLSAIFFVHSIFASVQDASVDALAISTILQRERGRMTAIMRGGFFGGYFDGFGTAVAVAGAAPLRFSCSGYYDVAISTCPHHCYFFHQRKARRCIIFHRCFRPPIERFNHPTTEQFQQYALDFQGVVSELNG